MKSHFIFLFLFVTLTMSLSFGQQEKKVFWSEDIIRNFKASLNVDGKER